MIKKILFTVLFLVSSSAVCIDLHINNSVVKTKIFIIPNCDGSARAYIYNAQGVTHIVFRSGANKSTIDKIDNIIKSKGLARMIILECMKKDEAEYNGTGVLA